MNNNEMEFDPTQVEGIDQSSVENAGVTYPTIQWHYGDAKLKKAGGMDYQGGWFIKADQIDEQTLLDAGWVKTSWSHDNGAEDEGFYRREIAASIIAMRKRWEVADGSLRRSFAWSDYEIAKTIGRPSSRTHVLALVKGLEESGPVILTLKGSAAMAFEGMRQQAGALTQFTATVIQAANKASELAAKKAGQRSAKRWPYRAFWLPVGAARSANGEPIFIEVGRDKSTSRVVLPVALGLPARADDVRLGAFYIGNELLARVNDLWAEAEANWTHAWDALSPGQVEGTPTATAETTVETAETNRDNGDVLASLGL